MKKILKWAIGVFVALAFVGCTMEMLSDGNETTPAVVENSQNQSEPAEDKATDNNPSEEPKADVEESEQPETPGINDDVTDKPVDDKDVVYFNPVAHLDENKVKAEIKEKAEKDWPGDYIMQELVIDESLAAYNRLKRIKVTSKVEQDALQSSLDVWAPDYIVVELVYQEQMKSYEKLN